MTHPGAIRLCALLFGTPGLVLAQQAPATPGITRVNLLKRPLPAGDFRHVEALTLELAPGAAAPRHRHDVAVVAYVLEGEVENQFDGGPSMRHRAGESWWEAPGTVHRVARNASATARARLLIVYVAEDGKANTVRLEEPPGTTDPATPSVAGFLAHPPAVTAAAGESLREPHSLPIPSARRPGHRSLD